MSRSARAAAIGKFVWGIYWQRVQFGYWGYVKKEPLSRLQLASGRADPHRIYEEMRAAGPLLPTRLGNFSTTNYRICNDLLRSRTFGPIPLDDSADLGVQDFLDLSILQLNPPDHTRIRRLAAPAFTPRKMAGYQPVVRGSIDRLLDRAAADGEFDLVSGFAAPLPIEVITKLLGLPDDPVKFRRLGSTIARALDGVWSLRQARTLAAARSELEQTFTDFLAERAAHPGDDLTSALLAQQGQQITAEELGALVSLLLIAGFETTVNAIGNGMRALLANPDQWQLLVDDPSRAPAVAEEVLRYDPPVQQTARVAFADTEVGGHLIRRNQWVIALLGAANRDPEVFSDPQRFDIGRDRSAEHLAFSGGIHYCLGSPLARMELALALAALAERFPKIRSTAPVTMRPGTTLRGPLKMPVAVR